jgi:hypothetical protein
MKITLGFALAMTVGLVLAVAPMPAHHSFAAEFDGAKPADLVGTVTKVDWVNPHSWIYIDVKSDDGPVANWGSHTLAARQITTPDGRKLFAGSPDNGPKQ